jgi:hypothetical protein
MLSKCFFFVKAKTNDIKRNKILSSDEDLDNFPREADHRNYWIEVYLEKEREWCSIEPSELKVNTEPEFFEMRFAKPILYVCAFDNNNRVKDVTKRYAEEWCTTTRLLRVSHLEEKKLWWERTLLHLQPFDALLDIEEEKKLKGDLIFWLTLKRWNKMISIFFFLTNRGSARKKHAF